MNIYKAPNLIISPKCKVLGGGGINDESIYTHTLSLSHKHTYYTHTHNCHSVRKRRLLGQEKKRLHSRLEGRCRVGMMEWAWQRVPQNRGLIWEFVSSKGFQTEWRIAKEMGVRGSTMLSRRNVELQEMDLCCLQIWRQEAACIQFSVKTSNAKTPLAELEKCQKRWDSHWNKYYGQATDIL